MSPRIPSLLPIALLAFLTAGCGRGTGPAGGAARGGTAVVGVRQDVDTFNLYAATTAFTQEIIDQLFLRLAREQPAFGDGPPRFLPELAESWEFGDDRLTLTFHLRRDVVWSDGVPTTAHDVAYSFRIARDPDVAWINADVKQQIESVEVIDDHTVRFRFTQRYPYQLMDANDGNIYPKHVLETIPVPEWRATDWTGLLVYNGPFLLEDHRRNDSFTLLRNPGYYDSGRPGLDRAVFRIVPDPNALLTQLLAGEIDVMQDLPPKDIDRVRDAGRLRTFDYPDRYFQYLCWNGRNPLFAEPEVRRALSMAIDMDAILDALMYGTAKRATSPIISVFYEHHRDLTPVPHAPHEARRLLARHGWEDRDGDGRLDRDGRPFSFELEINTGNQLREDAAVLIQAQLKDVGVEARPRRIEMSVFQKKHLDRDFDAFIAGWRVSTKVDYLETLFHTDSPANYCSYSNPRIDEIVTAAPMLPDPRAALPLWREAQEILYRDQPYTLMYERLAVHGVSDRLRGVQMDHLGPFAHLREWWIPPDERRF